MRRPLPRNVDLTACLLGGQAFTWWPVLADPGERGSAAPAFEGVARATHVSIDVVAGTWSSTPPREGPFLERYLGRDRTRPSALAGDPDLGPLAAKLAGLRLLDQDPWEGFVQFLLSPVNNVPRIQETVARLSRALGPRVGAAHALPSPEAVAGAGPDRLRALGTGFRGPRLHAAAMKVVHGDLDLKGLRTRPLDEAFEQLVALDGVGPKVAECILCYALGFDDAFPVDRWVMRASEALFGEVLTPAVARERWGDRAAMAQQLLFHGARMGLVAGVAASPVSGFARWRSLG